MSKTLDDDLEMVGDENNKPSQWEKTEPGSFMKHMDTSLESFFY